LKKKIFCFLVGERGSTNAYRVIAGEKIDLKDWQDKKNKHQWKKLQLFKKNLAGDFNAYFSDIKVSIKFHITRMSGCYGSTGWF